MRMCGGCLTICWRSAWVVSPVRSMARMPGAGWPSSSGDLGDLGEGVFEVALDVVAEGLKGRDVEDLDFVR